MPETGTIRKAVSRDAREIQRLVNAEADKGLMLALSLSDIFERIRAFWIVEENSRLVGVCALHVVWEDLAEIRSLAVDGGARAKGFGRRLVETCLDEALRLGVPRVFALTYQGEFFRRLGFKPVDKGELPQKIWSHCLKCVKFPDCDEEAYMIHLGDTSGHG